MVRLNGESSVLTWTSLSMIRYRGDDVRRRSVSSFNFSTFLMLPSPFIYELLHFRVQALVTRNWEITGIVKLPAPSSVWEFSSYNANYNVSCIILGVRNIMQICVNFKFPVFSFLVPGILFLYYFPHFEKYKLAYICLVYIYLTQPPWLFHRSLHLFFIF